MNFFRSNVLSGNRHALLADTGAFTTTLTLIEELRTTNVTSLIHLDRFDVGGEEGEHTLNTNAVRDLTYGESSCGTLSLFLDHVSFEGLDTLFGSFDDLIVDGNAVACLEGRESLVTGHLLVDVRYRVHDFSF